MTHVYIVTVQEYYKSMQLVGVYSNLDKANAAFHKVTAYFSKRKGGYIYTIIKAPVDAALNTDEICFGWNNITKDMELIVKDCKDDGTWDEDE